MDQEKIIKLTLAAQIAAQMTSLPTDEIISKTKDIVNRLYEEL